jgi:hypothetical protein
VIEVLRLRFAINSAQETPFTPKQARSHVEQRS